MNVKSLKITSINLFKIYSEQITKKDLRKKLILYLIFDMHY